MEPEIKERDEGKRRRRWAITKKDLQIMDEQLDQLWAMKQHKAREREREKDKEEVNISYPSNQEEISSSDQKEWEVTIANQDNKEVSADDQKEWEINLNEITFKELIAKDEYTLVEVYKGFYKGQYVTVTVFELRENKLPSWRSPFREKVAIWNKIDHPNLVKLIGAKIDEPEFALGVENDEIRLLSKMSYIVVEHLCGDTLNSFLSKHSEKKLSFKLVIQLALHLARGLAYLHSKKLIHGNVKPENMLLDKNFKLIITDFEISNAEISNHEEVITSDDTQTICYMAPEVTDSKPYERKCDVYSFGICLWEIYCCETPCYHNSTFPELISADFYKKWRPEIPKGCPKAIAKLMHKCWDRDPSQRPEMEEVVSTLEAFDKYSKGKKVPQGCFCFHK